MKKDPHQGFVQDGFQEETERTIQASIGSAPPTSGYFLESAQSGTWRSEQTGDEHPVFPMLTCDAENGHNPPSTAGPPRCQCCWMGGRWGCGEGNARVIVQERPCCRLQIDHEPRLRQEVGEKTTQAMRWGEIGGSMGDSKIRHCHRRRSSER
jgi:hypothetical protein